MRIFCNINLNVRVTFTNVNTASFISTMKQRHKRGRSNLTVRARVMLSLNSFFGFTNAVAKITSEKFVTEGGKGWDGTRPIFWKFEPQIRLDPYVNRWI